MIRNPFSLKKMEYQAQQGMVVYRSRHHATLKRNFQIMPGADEPVGRGGGEPQQVRGLPRPRRPDEPVGRGSEKPQQVRGRPRHLYPNITYT